MTDQFEDLGEGRSIVRDELGRVKRATLSPEVASAMSKSRGQKAASLDELLAGAGFDDESNPAPPWLKALAGEIASGGSGMSSNVKLFLSLAGLTRNETPTHDVKFVDNTKLIATIDGALYQRMGPAELHPFRDILGAKRHELGIVDDDGEKIDAPGWLELHRVRGEIASERVNTEIP